MPLLTVLQSEPLQTGIPECRSQGVGWFHEPDPKPCHEGLEPQLEARETPKKKGKSVHFDLDQTAVRLIPSRSEMSPRQVHRLWIDDYSRKENKQEVVNTLFLMRAGLGNRLTEEDFFCSRGLEHLVHRDRKKANVRKSIAIALAMQRLLRQKGTQNPAIIAKVYEKYTLKSRETAHQLAIHDYAESIRRRRRARKHKRLRRRLLTHPPQSTHQNL